MTTNVFDINSGLMTSDSRWSIRSPDQSFIIVLDNSGFDKLQYFDANNVGYSVMFAGNAQLICQWKQWLKNGALDPQPPFVINGQTFTICIAENKSKNIDFVRGIDIQTDSAVFAGSGALSAYGCWAINSCAVKAVETAKTHDRCSGGDVRYINMSSLDNNINLALGSEILMDSFLEKGMVMYTNPLSTPQQTNGVPLKEAAANDGEVKKIMDDIANGSAIANAPCDAMYTPWSEEEKSKLNSAIAKIFAK